MPAALPHPRLSRRTLVVGLAGAVVLALAYVAARETPFFAVRTVEVAGASPEVDAQVRAALASAVGTSLVALDAADVEARVDAIPWVRTARADRAFPHTLSVRVRLERALAVIRDGERAWLVSETGRVLTEMEPSARARLPRIRTEPVGPLRVGRTIADGAVRTTLSVVRAIPPRFPERVLYADVAGGSATLMLPGGVELRLGPPQDAAPKLRAAAAVLAALERDEREAIVYVDVSVPEHAVVGQTLNLDVNVEG
jgi:cell division protein FtsQ